tara:strand:- start:467 stop:904 length:438 start_codon:yes stop_codon:yes gene_type:complete
MPTPVTNSPAELLRASIVTAGFGTQPSTASTWPVFVGHMPDLPDNSVCVYDTSGSLDGRVQRGGETIEHPGWQVRVRATDHPTGYAKIATIRNHIDTILREGIVIGASSYTIQAANLTGGVQTVGQEPEGTRRNNFTINGTLTYT